MPYDDFDGADVIYLQPGNLKNVYRFAFLPANSITDKGSIPYGTSVSSVVVSGYNTDDENVSSIMIDEAPTVTSNIVSIKLNYPGSEGTHRLKFLLTLNDSSVYEKDFRRIRAIDL